MPKRDGGRKIIVRYRLTKMPHTHRGGESLDREMWKRIARPVHPSSYDDKIFNSIDPPDVCCGAVSKHPDRNIPWNTRFNANRTAASILYIPLE